MQAEAVGVTVGEGEGSRGARPRYLRIIDRRLERLEQAVYVREARGDAATYERSEMAMLRVGRSLIEERLLEQVGQAYSTAFLLEEAAAHLEQRDPTLSLDELVQRLRARASLLTEATSIEPEEGE